MSLFQNFRDNIKNIPGWHTTKKIVTIECDDWGGINMPSNEVYDRLVIDGLAVGHRIWNRFDTLESAKDLEQLFEVLDSVRDHNNNPAVMTSFTSMANPDFDKIKSGGFVKYYYEKFTDTYKHYYQDNDVFTLWREGMDARLFVPELHGHEHIAVQLWIAKLQEGNIDLLLAFDQGFVSTFIPDVTPPANGLRAEFYFTSDEQKPFLIDSLIDSVNLFKNIFGHLPKVFVPANGIFHPDFDAVVASSGIKFLCVGNSMPYPANGGNLKYRHFISGQRGYGGLTYYTRNCSFDSTQEEYKGIDQTMQQIAAAFRWGKPAIISTHRVNFIGGLVPANRDRGLIELKKLLNSILRKWPDVEFLSSGDALEFMSRTN